MLVAASKKNFLWIVCAFQSPKIYFTVKLQGRFIFLFLGKPGFFWRSDNDLINYDPTFDLVSYIQPDFLFHFSKCNKFKGKSWTWMYRLSRLHVCSAGNEKRFKQYVSLSVTLNYFHLRKYPVQPHLTLIFIYRNFSFCKILGK